MAKRSAKEKPKKIGRPSLYSKKIADKICLLIATSSKGLRAICKDNPGLPDYATIFKWLRESDKQYFIDSYARAREDQADFLADEMMEISDHTEEDHTAFTGINVVNRDRLRIDTRKWIAAKLKPKKYADKIDQNINHTITNVSASFGTPIQSPHQPGEDSP